MEAYDSTVDSLLEYVANPRTSTVESISSSVSFTSAVKHNSLSAMTAMTLFCCCLSRN